MPTPQEQVTQIEIALRRRFFPLVPKIETSERVSWTEDQHDTDRLSRCLAAYALVGLCEVDDAIAAGAITDGKNDGGIDALYFYQANNQLFFVQAKFKRTGASPSQDEILKTINGIRALQARRFEEFNYAFQNRIDEIESTFDTPGVQLQVVVIFLGDNLSPHVVSDLDALKAELNQLSPLMDWKGSNRATVYGWLIAEQTPSPVNAEITLEHWAAVIAPRKAIYGQISAASLAQLVENVGKSLFERNIRLYLGSIGVNTAIERTVRTRPKDFFYLNNGITAVAQSITTAPGTSARCAFRLTNVSIVNGAQTAGSIATAASAGQISEDARLLITVIEIGDGADDISRRITRARNYQNQVRGVDFAALDPHQEQLRQELALAGITYHYRPSAEARARREDAFTLEEAAVSLACLSLRTFSSVEIQQVPARSRQNAVDVVVTAKKEIGRLWEQEGALYSVLFPPSLSGMRMCRLVRVYRFIDQILAASERSETAYFRRMFFRHGRYFVMALVAHRLPDVISRPELILSDSDKTLLSQQTNQLAELVYAQSQPLQAIKGYLSIFRNLTDSQPLADGVLQRLAQLAAAQPQVSTPPPNPVQ